MYIIIPCTISWNCSEVEEDWYDIGEDVNDTEIFETIKGPNGEVNDIEVFWNY